MVAPLPAWTKTLWIAIRGFQGAGRACRATYESIGERCINEHGNGMDKAQVSRGVSMLIEAGFLERPSSRKLRCIVPQKLTPDQQKVDPQSTKVDQESTNRGKPDGEKLTSDQQKLTSDQQKVDDSSTPSENQQENQQRKPKTNTVRAGVRADAVEAIYQAYPRHVGKKKAMEKIETALRLIAKRNGIDDPAAWLLRRVEAFAASPKGQAGRYCPYPATWFHQGRYDDDPAEWRTRDEHDKHDDGYFGAATTDEERNRIYRAAFGEVTD